MPNILQRNNVTVIGTNKPAMIFAHGFGCDQNTWRYIYPAFTSDYQVILFDYVGAGKSDLSSYSTERYNSLKGYSQDVLDICEELNLTSTIFIGHSVSSMIGMLAALQKPAYFKKLIFIGPSASYLNAGDYKGGMEADDLEALFEVMDSNYLGWSRSLAPAIMGNQDRPELGTDLANSFCATDPDIAKEFARVTFLSYNRFDLPKLTVESLSMQCSEDILAPEQVGRYILENTPGNTLIELKATGHCPQLSAPQEVIKAIKSYIK